MNTNQEYQPDYTHMQATGKAIELCAELEKIGQIPSSFQIMFGGELLTIIVQREEPKEVAATQEEPQDIPIEVGSKWSYMGMEPDTVIGVTDEEITTESTGRTSESGWSRKEFLMFHTRVCGPAGLDQLKAGFEP